MAAAAAASSADQFTAAEQEVAAILCGFPELVLAAPRLRRRSRRQPEIPSWGRKRSRTAPAEKAGGAADGAASPDTPLGFPASGGEEEEPVKKPRRHREWVEEQSGVVARLSQENAHLLQQIEEYRARLESSRAANESLKQMRNKIKQQQEEEEEQARKQAMPNRADAHGAAALELELDLNAPVRSPGEEAAAAAEWCRAQQVMHRATVTAAARKRRLEIRRSKNSSLPAAAATASPCRAPRVTG